MRVTYKKHLLNFKRPGGTSRGVLHTKETWFIEIHSGQKYGIGECGLFRGLSVDDRPDYEQKLRDVCESITSGKDIQSIDLNGFPSIQFGLETAIKSFESTDCQVLYPSEFTQGKQGIPINGLIWMGSEEYMKQQIKEKLQQGFSCIKMKIGAIDFDTEVRLLQSIRKEFSAADVTLRVDANGAFSPKEALNKLKVLSDLQLHSIEQPIRAGQWQEMAHLCQQTPLPIALDEELIGVVDQNQQELLLATIRPQFVILKPSLIGGFSGSDLWIALAAKYKSGWWMTSALESNVGLNAIAQYTFDKGISMPQGLGTGSLFTNNTPSKLKVVGEKLFYLANN